MKNVFTKPKIAKIQAETITSVCLFLRLSKSSIYLSTYVKPSPHGSKKELSSFSISRSDCKPFFKIVIKGITAKVITVTVMNTNISAPKRILLQSPGYVSGAPRVTRKMISSIGAVATTAAVATCAKTTIIFSFEKSLSSYKDFVLAF